MTTNAHSRQPDKSSTANLHPKARKGRAVGIGLWRVVRRFFRAQTAHREAVTLAHCLHGRYYAGVAPQWEPDDDTTHVVLQISNMTAGLGDQLDHAETLLCNALPPPHCTPEEWRTLIRGWRDRKHGLSPNQ
jgi:hypothetical protein